MRVSLGDSSLKTVRAQMVKGNSGEKKKEKGTRARRNMEKKKNKAGDR